MNNLIHFHISVEKKKFVSIQDMRKSKTLLTSTNADQKSLLPVFLIANGRQSGDLWQSKSMFLTIFGLHS